MTFREHLNRLEVLLHEGYDDVFHVKDNFPPDVSHTATSTLIEKNQTMVKTKQLYYTLKLLVYQTNIDLESEISPDLILELERKFD